MILWHQNIRVLDYSIQDHGVMDLSDLGELQRAAKKLQKFGGSSRLLFDYPKGLSLRNQPGECAKELSTLKFTKGPRMAKDMVQYLLLLGIM